MVKMGQRKKSIFSVTLRPTDTLWTKYMRRKYDFTCQWCGRVYPEENCGNLGVSHFHGRGHENTRFDEENTILVCTIPCHRFLDSHRTEYKQFMLKRLGQEKYDLLELRCNIRKDRNDVGDKIIIKRMLEELNGS